jgi:hypothetical protein
MTTQAKDEEWIELAAIVRKTVGPRRWEDVLVAAERAHNAIFKPPWSELDETARMRFVGMTATLYSTGYAAGIDDGREYP